MLLTQMERERKQVAEFLIFFTYQPVQMGDQPVHYVQEQSAHKDPGDGDEQSVFSPVFQRGDDESENRRCQHDPCCKSNDQVIEFMGCIFKKKTDSRTDDGGSANAGSGQKYHRHKITCLNSYAKNEPAIFRHKLPVAAEAFRQITDALGAVAMVPFGGNGNAIHKAGFPGVGVLYGEQQLAV